MHNERSERSFHSARSIRILLLTYYFPPEQTPGAFRSEALLDALLALGNGDSPVFVDVVTAQPSRYRTSTTRGDAEETGPSHRIRRLSLPGRAASYIGQGGDFLTFASQARKAVKHERYDLVLATTSRQMTGLLGAWIAARKDARFYLDVRDLFAQNLKTMFPWPLRAVASVAKALERWMLQRADRINAVSEGFVPYLRDEAVNADIRCFPNGIDDLFCLPAGRPTRVDSNDLIEIVYAGNIGAGQELHRIIPQLAARLGKRGRLNIFGDGRQLALLQSAVDRGRLTNVALNPPVAREELPAIYAQADVLLLHLGGAASLQGVLPSKVFEYAASGRPIIAGVSGYAARFIAEEIENSAVFPPGDVDAALDALSKLSMSYTDRSTFVRRFSRKEMMRRMAEDVLTLATMGPKKLRPSRAGIP